MKKPLFFFSFIFLLGINAVTAQSQIDLLTEDMLLVADNYAAPGAEGAALQASAGWFTTARASEKWQIDVSIHGNALFIPRGKESRLSRNSNFSVLNLRSGSSALLPTVFGGKTEEVFEGEIQNPIGSGSIPFNFNAIEGLDKEVLLHPFAQVTVGLPYGTDVAVRFLPRVAIDDVGFSTYGVGIKHNFSQYIKFSRPDDFQFAAAITYSNFNVDYAFAPIAIPFDVLEINRIDVDANLFFFQLMGSKLYNNFEVLGAIGTTISSFDYEMGGSGLILDPLNTSLGGLGESSTKIKGDIGFNYMIGNFKISSMITASSFFNVNMGVHYRIK